MAINVVIDGNTYRGVEVVDIDGEQVSLSSASGKINATFGGTLFTDITAITAGGKNLELSIPEAGVLYRLPTPMVFDGSNYVDTGLKLFEEDVDFSIAYMGTAGDGIQSNAKIFSCREPVVPTYGLGCSMTSCEGYGMSENIVVFSSARKEPMHVLLTHAKGSNAINLYVSISNGSMETRKTNNAWTYEATSQNLIVGADNSASHGKKFIGTMKGFVVYDHVLSDSEKQEFFATEA